MLESMQDWKRTHYCGTLRAEHAGETVVVTGWVDTRRDHGGLIFVDLRDRAGIVQIVFSPDTAPEAFTKAEAVRSEYVLAVTGTVQRRPEETENENIATGQVEIICTELRVLNNAQTPPFYIEDGIDVDENLRLRHRYLDLRRPEMQENMKLRHRGTKVIRDFLDSQGFWEIETPMLTRSTPEGARDYLVPSRVNDGKFYALPQSPQLFKQLLMVSGMDRYFQIARCFRDEDLRADRQPEFTQVDLEMSFVEVDDILELMEKMMQRMFKETIGMEVERPFPRLSYHEAMERFGSDKPDIRFGLELVDISDLAEDCGFKVFNAAVNSGGVVKGINAPGCSIFTRKEIDDLTKFAAIYKAKGLAYLVITEDGVKSPIAKFFTEREMDTILTRFEAKPGDIIFFVADRHQVAYDTLGALRLHLAERLDLIPTDKYQFLWVLDFPLVAYDDEGKRWEAMHHPFTSPRDEDIPLLDSDPSKARAKAYDMVLNGVEVGGGSIRIHRGDVQEKMFSVIGLDKEQAREKFGFMLDAFEYGAPPHGGIAFGLDRLLMLLAKRKTIRDVIPFPKTQSATDLMVSAPDSVEPEQLRELHIKTIVKSKKG
ncbi:MAG: aspartate--tRNA ligase [Firmicutes bacterium]|nr:aspartate--tRNA ligase [Bacillota bacterium]